jgi:hypothetical protein
MAGGMFTKGFWTLVLVGPLLTATPSQAPADPIALTGPQIVGALVGNSIIGTDDDNERYLEHFATDRTVAGLSEDGTYRGWWSVTGDSLCLRFPLTEEEMDPDYEDPASDMIFDTVDCYHLFMDGARIHFVPRAGNDAIYVAELVSGKPDGL